VKVISWRTMTVADLPAVATIGDQVHAAYPESPLVAAERLHLFPAGCWVAEGDAVAGYALAHPTVIGRPPALDTLLGALPTGADGLHLHDIALLPAARAAGLGRQLVERLVEVASTAGLKALTLISVHDSQTYWERHGFAPYRHSESILRAALASYGVSAPYLVRQIARAPLEGLTPRH
jgi:GNAT superfamily N-acetyltransferase